MNNESKMIKDCTFPNLPQTIVIENQGRPEISAPIEDIMFCMANKKETEIDEFNQKHNKYYAYKIDIGEDGHPIFVCTGRYE